MGFFDIFRRKPKTAWDALQAIPEFKQQKELFDAMHLLCEDGVDADELPNGHGEFGLAATNPIPCKTVFGSIAYLGKLRTPDGTKVVYERVGSLRSDVSPHPIDAYEIRHSNGNKLAILYFSPYHKRNSSKVPRDFGVIGAPNSGPAIAAPEPKANRRAARKTLTLPNRRLGPSTTNDAPRPARPPHGDMKTTVLFTGLATSLSKDGVTYTISTIHRKEFGGLYQTSILRHPEGRIVYRIEVGSQLQSAQEHIDAVRIALSKPESAWLGTKDIGLE